jgi:hypothetical protein
MWRVALILGALAISSAGCAGKQDYQVLAFDQRDQLLQEKAVVVEGRVIASKHTLNPTFDQYLFFFVPQSVSTGNPRFDATVAIDRVLKGDVSSNTIELSDYRAIRPEEDALFADGYAIHNNSVLRLGFDRHSGNRLTDLVIVPLGNTPEFDDALRQAAAMRSRAATRPISRPSP